MRIKIATGRDTQAGRTLAGYIQKIGYALVNDLPTFTVHLEESSSDIPIIDGVDGDLERRIIYNMEDLGIGKFILQRSGGIRAENSIKIIYPTGTDEIVARSIARAVQEAFNTTKTIEPPTKENKFIKLLKTIFLIPILLVSTEVQAQQFVYGRAWDSVNLAGVDPGDSTNRAIRVNMVSGTISGADGAILDGVSSSIKATVFDYANSNPLAVRLTDTSGNFVAGGGGTSSSFGAAFPATGTGAGFFDGTNMQGARVFDADTGGGTQYLLGVNLRQVSGGGSVETGVQPNPIYVRTEPVGSSSTITAVSQQVTNSGLINYPSTWTVEISGTWVGTIEFQGKASAATYNTTQVVRDSNGDLVTNTTTNGVFRAPGGWETFRVFSTAWTSGTANISIHPGGTSNVFLSKSLPTGTNTIGAVNLAQYTPVSSRLPVDANISQMNGVAVTMGNGASGTGVQRVTIASDSTGQIAVASFPDNEPINVAQLAGVAPNLNSGDTTTGTQRVVLGGAPTLAHNQVSVATTVGGTVICASRAGRRSVVIMNHGTTVVYLGNTGLTTSTGLYLAGVAGAAVSIPTSAAVYGIVAAGTQTVSYMEVY